MALTSLLIDSGSSGVPGGMIKQSALQLSKMRLVSPYAFNPEVQFALILLESMKVRSYGATSSRKVSNTMCPIAMAADSLDDVHFAVCSEAALMKIVSCDTGCRVVVRARKAEASLFFVTVWLGTWPQPCLQPSSKLVETAANPSKQLEDYRGRRRFCHKWPSVVWSYRLPLDVWLLQRSLVSADCSQSFS